MPDKPAANGSADLIEVLQAQLGAARRTQILDAATRVFASKGFNHATIREVAQAAGVADGTIYNYFANKTDLLFGLLDRLNDTERRPASLTQATEATASDFADVGDAFRAYFRAYVRERVEALWSSADLFHAVLPELLANPALRTRYHDEVIAPTMALGEGAFGALVANGTMRDQDVALSVRIVAGSVLGLMVLQLLGDETLAARWHELPDALAEMLLPGLTPPDSAHNGNDAS